MSGPSVRVSIHSSGETDVHGGNAVPLPRVPWRPKSVSPGHIGRPVTVAFLGPHNSVHGGTAVPSGWAVSRCSEAVDAGTIGPPVLVSFAGSPG